MAAVKTDSIKDVLDNNDLTQLRFDSFDKRLNFYKHNGMYMIMMNGELAISTPDFEKAYTKFHKLIKD